MFQLHDEATISKEAPSNGRKAELTSLDDQAALASNARAGSEKEAGKVLEIPITCRLVLLIGYVVMETPYLE